MQVQNTCAVRTGERLRIWPTLAERGNRILLRREEVRLLEPRLQDVDGKGWGGAKKCVETRRAGTGGLDGSQAY